MKQRYQANKDDIGKIRAVKKAIQFSNEDEKKRHQKFQLELRDCFSFICICCHKIMSISGVQPIDLAEFKQKLEREAPGLYDKSIQDPPKEAFLNDKHYICTTCKKWLFQKKKIPKIEVPKPEQVTGLFASLAGGLFNTAKNAVGMNDEL